MKTVVKRFVNRASVVVAGASLLTVSAFAQVTPPDFDYGDSIDAFTTNLQTFITANGPKLLIALLLALSFGVVWRLIRKATRSVG
jgi:hypothetical protein